MKRNLWVLSAGLALVLAGCAGAPPSGPQEITLTALDLVYEPKTFEVAAGRPVVLTMVNEGALEHDFSIMEIHVEIMSEVQEEEMQHDMSGMEMEPELHFSAPAGETRSIEFTPTEAGSYEFFCTVAGHKEAGMVGTLLVTAP